jgi:Asp-tRNA(Asn)/Glu-tRNA(Gln) amidotransferase A subunit family amidase
VFQSPWTVLGWPGFTLPTGVGPSRLPIGLQLVGAPFQEGRLAGAAQWVEHLLGRMPAPKDAASP